MATRVSRPQGRSRKKAAETGYSAEASHTDPLSLAENNLILETVQRYFREERKKTIPPKLKQISEEINDAIKEA